MRNFALYATLYEQVSAVKLIFSYIEWNVTACFYLISGLNMSIQSSASSMDFCQDHSTSDSESSADEFDLA